MVVDSYAIVVGVVVRGTTAFATVVTPVDFANGNAVRIRDNLDAYFVRMSARYLGCHFRFVTRGAPGVNRGVDAFHLNCIIHGEFAVPMKLLGVILRPERGSGQYEYHRNEQQGPEILGGHNPIPP